MQLGNDGDAKSVQLDYTETMRANVIIPKTIPSRARRAAARVMAEAMDLSRKGNGLVVNFVPQLILNKRRYGNKKESYVNRVMRHCAMWLNRDFKGLMDDVKQATSRTKPKRDMSKEELAAKKVEFGLVTPAMTALQSTAGLADPEDDAVKTRVEGKHPVGDPIPTPPNLPQATDLHLGSVNEAKKLLQQATRGKSAGPSRLTNEMLRETCLLKSEEGGAALTSFMAYVNTFIDGAFDKSQAPFINAARLIAKIKSEKDERPIAIGEVLRRLACRWVARKKGEEAAAYLSPLQVGVEVQGGGETVARGLSVLFHQHNRDPNVAMVSVDGKNAFNEADRRNMLEQVERHFPSLVRIAYFLYGGPAVLYFGQNIILSRCGTHQGCPLGGLFFALAIHPILKEIKVRISGGNDDVRGDNDDLLFLAAYFDNIYVVINNKGRNAPILLDAIREIGGQVGYTMGKNCFIVCPGEPLETNSQAMDLDTAQAAPRQLFGLTLKHNYVALGYPIGEDDFVHNWLDEATFIDSNIYKLLITQS
jgi:hypothetical protein